MTDILAKSNSECGPTRLSGLPLLNWRTSYGTLGLNGQLGYENKLVQVQSELIDNAISAHGPSEVQFLVPDTDRIFSCRVALNDDVLGRTTSADFVISADDDVLAVAAGVRPGESPRELTARLRAPCTLNLRVETTRFDSCHSLWIDPCLHDAYAISQAPWRDALQRVEVSAYDQNYIADIAVITVLTREYAPLVDQLLASLAVYGCCPKVKRFVFAIEPDAACEAVIARHGATALRCRRLGPLNSALKAVLYSAASVINARQYLCLDADTLVLGDLRPLFNSLEALPDDRVLVAKDSFMRSGTLGDQLTRHYAGKATDLGLLLGTAENEAGYPFVVNDGVFAGSRRALLSVESILRSLPGAAAWTDQLHDHGWRNQFLFNLVLARLNCGVELDGIFNVQMHMNDVQWEKDVNGGVHAVWRGRPCRILHFCGWGRDKNVDWRRQAAQNCAASAALK
jgi:hypothetical protein